MYGTSKRTVEGRSHLHVYRDLLFKIRQHI